MDWIKELGWDQWSFTANDIWGLLAVYAVIALSLGLYAFLKNKGNLVDRRKIIHIGVGQFIWIWWIFSAPWVMLAFFAIPFTIILFLAMYDNNPIGRSKLGSITGEGHRSGLFFYALAITVLVALCFNHWVAATIGIVAMTTGDGLGSVFGRRFGKHKTIHGKSFEGAFAVFAATALVSAVVIVFYTWLSTQGISRPLDVTPIIDWFWCPIIAGLLASVAETVCDGDYDNLLIPCLVTLAMIGLGF